MDDRRTLITHLCAELDHCRRMLLDDRQVTHPLADRARAVLAADGPAVPEGREPASVVSEPSDEELLEKGPSLEEVEELCEEHCFNVEGYESIECLQGLINDALARWGSRQGSLDSSPPANGEVADALADGPAVPEGREPAAVMGEPSDQEIYDLWTGAEPASFARAVLARWGHQPAPAAEGEVVRWLRSLEDASVWFESGSPESLKLTRAADLLAQRHPAPVPVSERLPGPEDCDGEGRCWAWHSFDPEEDDSGDCWMTIPCEWLEGSERWTHWLPAHALPLPASWGGDCDKTSTPANR